MTGFEKMKYLYRNAGKASSTEGAEKKTVKEASGRKAARKKKPGNLPETAGEKTDEERSSGFAENIQG